jgi:hypothetical protein
MQALMRRRLDLARVLLEQGGFGVNVTATAMHLGSVERERRFRSAAIRANEPLQPAEERAEVVTGLPQAERCQGQQGAGKGSDQDLGLEPSRVVVLAEDAAHASAVSARTLHHADIPSRQRVRMMNVDLWQVLEPEAEPDGADQIIRLLSGGELRPGADAEVFVEGSDCGDHRLPKKNRYRYRL